MSWADDLSGKVRRATRLSLNSIGRQWVAYLRWKCGIPVENLPGFGIIRSDPYEAPRKEFGVLWRAFKYKVAPKATGIQDLRVFIDQETFIEAGKYNYSMDLEYGRESTNLLPRPYWRPTTQEIVPHLQEWFEREFAAQMARTDDAAPFESSDAAADFPASGGAALLE